MADFKAGDRVVKMSGFSAGKYGTVNSVLENGTLNVTFDGERLPKYCAPERCGQVAANAAGDKREYYVVDAWGNKADGSMTPLPFDRASALFLKLTGSKRGNGKWGIVHKDEPNSKARDWFGNIVEWSIPHNSRVRNDRVKIGDRVVVKRWPEYGEGTVVKKYGKKWVVRPDRQSDERVFVPTFAFDEAELAFANSRAANARALDKGGRPVKEGDTIDTPKGLAEVVAIKMRPQGLKEVASYVGVTYTPGGRHVEEWLMADVHGTVRATLQNAARNAVARNNVGDCFSDATAWLEDAYKAASNPSKAKTMIARARQDVGGPYGVLSYDGVDAKAKRHLSATLAAIDKAASNPTPENIMAARWESEKGRAHADGGSPRRAFWS